MFIFKQGLAALGCFFSNCRILKRVSSRGRVRNGRTCFCCWCCSCGVLLQSSHADQGVEVTGWQVAADCGLQSTLMVVWWLLPHVVATGGLHPPLDGGAWWGLLGQRLLQELTVAELEAGGQLQNTLLQQLCEHCSSWTWDTKEYLRKWEIHGE